MGRSSGTRRDWTVSPLSPPPSPGLFPSSPNPLLPASSPGTQAHTGLRRGLGKGATAPSSLAFLDKLRRLVGSGLPGLGPRRGLGGEQRCHPSAQAPSHTPPGPRSIPAAPASLPRRTAGAGRGARRLRRGRGGLSAPWPGLNIYYVLFGLWGRGRRAVASVRSCRRGGAQRLGLGSGPAAPTEPPGLAGTRVPPARPLPGRGFCYGAAGPR